MHCCIFHYSHWVSKDMQANIDKYINMSKIVTPLCTVACCHVKNSRCKQHLLPWYTTLLHILLTIMIPNMSHIRLKH